MWIIMDLTQIIEKQATENETHPLVLQSWEEESLCKKKQEEKSKDKKLPTINFKRKVLSKWSPDTISTRS